jgi:putative transposase
MARRPRRLVAGGIYHVVNRGALRHALFADDADWPLFLGSLSDALTRHPVGLLGWCLMPNHWHLLVQPHADATLPAFMRWLTLAHCRRWQARHGKDGLGTLYQGRYRSQPVDGDAQLLTVLRYIERNPLRAGMVERATEWPWSSLAHRLAGRTGLLAPLPVAIPADWAAVLDTPLTPAEVEAAGKAAPAGAADRGRTSDARP